MFTGNSSGYKCLQDMKNANTLPVPSAESNCPYRRKYVYGYAVDGSDRPSYLLWPRRGADGHFWLVDPMLGNYFDPYEADFLESIGLEHFFDAFALVHKRSIREAAAEALEIPLEDIQDNLVVKQSSARRFELTPISVPDDPPAKRAKTTMEPVSSARDSTMATGDSNANQNSSAESDSDSSDSNSDFSNEDGSSDVSDLDKFEEAYQEFGKLTEGVNTLALTRNVAGDKSPLVGGLDTLYTLANVASVNSWKGYWRDTACKSMPPMPSLMSKSCPSSCLPKTWSCCLLFTWLNGLHLYSARC